MGKDLSDDKISSLKGAFTLFGTDGDVLDKDSTRFVSVNELRHILKSIDEKLELAEFDEWIREVDVSYDGKFLYKDSIARMIAE
ncbi:hypothetical protein RYX36_007286 [Vicia faba]